jgi:membrane protease YdiL (CAAX protease family)
MHNLKGILAGAPAFRQFAAFLASLLGGMVLLSCFALLLGLSGEAMPAGRLRLYQLLSEVCLFLAPALLLAWLCSARPASYLSLRLVADVRAWGLTLLSMILLSPFVTLTGFLNGRMKLPSRMEAVERWMQSLEASAQEVTNLLLSGGGSLSLLSNLIVVGLGAAVAEEFFFRGALRRLIERKIQNPHALVWIVAAIFSLVHLQFYGFVPRLLLGAYFGYLVYWSKSIWFPVFAHFINNAVAVAGMSSPQWREQSYISGEIPEGELVFFIFYSFIGLVLFFFCAGRLRRRLRQA